MVNITISQILMAVIFLMAVGLHTTRLNLRLVWLYRIQSLAVVGLLAASYFEQGVSALLLVAVVSLIAKVWLAPTFFSRLIERHKLHDRDTSYLPVWVALMVVVLLSWLASSRAFEPLTTLVVGHHAVSILAVATVLVSIFLMINRKGAFSQVLSVLSLENSVVAFGMFAGLEQSVALQMGVMFDVFVWIAIAGILVGMVYRHIGSLDVTRMRRLRD